jgi:hypothetical protein
MKETINKSGFKLKGKLIDIAQYPNGTEKILQETNNLVVDMGLCFIIGVLGGLEDFGILTMQVGEGLPEWDIELPSPEEDDTELVSPIHEKAVVKHYWDEVEGEFTLVPTPILDVRVTFYADEANGDLRELALRGGTTGEVMYNYIIHEKIVKTSDFNLLRIIRITADRTWGS